MFALNIGLEGSPSRILCEMSLNSFAEPDALAVSVLDHRHDKVLGRIDRDAKVIISLQNERVLRRRRGRIENRVLFKRGHRRLHQEGQKRDAIAFGLFRRRV